MNFRFGEFFSGPGGMAAGAMRAEVLSADGTKWGASPCWAVDSDPDSCLTYRLNIHRGDPEANVLCSDARQVDVDDLDDIDAFLFGFPCNDFSEAGKRHGLNGRFGPLYLEGVRVIEAKRPSWFVAENVSGLQHANERQAMKQIIDDLAKAGDGYEIVPHLYRFEDYGVPQQRRRIVIVGIRSDHAKNGVKFRPPAPTGPTVSARAALDPPMPDGTMNAEPYPASHEVVERLKAIRPGENIWDAQKRADFPDGCRLNVKGKHLSLIYKRLDPDRPAYTILSNGGGGTVGYHWSEPRPLTNRERARLQTFPDDYAFLGVANSVRSQIGMAVPPVAAERIVSAVLSSFAGVPYESVDQNISIGQHARRKSSRRQSVMTDANLAFTCTPSPQHSSRRTDLIRALLATRLAGGISRKDLFKAVVEFIPNISRKDVSNVILRLRALHEIEGDLGDSVIKLTPAALEEVRSMGKKNPFLTRAHNKERKEQRKVASAQPPAAKPAPSEGKHTNAELLATLSEALSLTIRGLGMMRGALYDNQGGIEALLGRDDAALLGDGVMEADRRLELATRRLRSLASERE